MIASRTDGADRRNRWTEIADRVFVAQYHLFRHNIGVVVDGSEAVVIDTRPTEAMGRELLDDLRALGRLRVAAAINTHAHWDHAFGNHAFRPAGIWAHARSRPFLDTRGEPMRGRAIAEWPEIREDLVATTIDPPDRLITRTTVLRCGSRDLVLDHLGRGHTDHDLVIRVLDADVLFVGDLFTGDRIPYFQDSYPLEWAATATICAGLSYSAVVPGHHDASRALLEEMAAGFRDLADMAGAIARGSECEEDAIRRHPFPAMGPAEKAGSVRRAVQHARSRRSRGNRGSA